MEKNIFSGRISLIFLFITLISIIGCSGSSGTSDSVENIRVGTEGLSVSFLANNPPDTVHAEENGANAFDVIMDIRNNGAFPQPEEISGIGGPVGNVYLSGYDSNIISITPKDSSGVSGNGIDLSRLPLDGKSTINPNGGQDILSFQGKIIDYKKLLVERYEPVLLATACYHYETTASTSVCIDPDPYSVVKQKKVCQASDASLTSQGAPIAVVKIAEEAFATKTTFKITVKNVGSGEVLIRESINKCDPYTTRVNLDNSGSVKIQREDLDKVLVESVKVSETLLNCGPYIDNSGAVKRTDGGLMRLLNGEGFIICELPSGSYAKTNSAYTTPLVVKLKYGYRTTTERKLLIKREMPSGTSTQVTV